MIEFTLKVTAKREKYTIFMLQNIGLFPLLDSATCVHIQKKDLRNFFKSGGFNQKRQLPTLPL